MKKVVKTSAIVYSMLGLLIGIGLFVYSLFAETLTFYLGDKEVHGVASGLLAVLFVPLLMGIVGMAHGVMIWFPIVYAYNKWTTPRNAPFPRDRQH